MKAKPQLCQITPRDLHRSIWYTHTLDRESKLSHNNYQQNPQNDAC